MSEPVYRIALFLKAPRPGTVKTRLAKDVGNEEACRIYRTLVERQLSQLPSGWPVDMWVAPAEGVPEMQDWLGKGHQYGSQVEGDLGERLKAGISGSLARGGEGVFCLGGDCPELDAAYLAQARKALGEGNEVVFGPTFDGGYSLVGLHSLIPEIFEGIPWSSSRTLEVSLEKAHQQGLKVHLLNPLSDVDTLEDWRGFI